MIWLKYLTNDPDALESFRAYIAKSRTDYLEQNLSDAINSVETRGKILALDAILAFVNNAVALEHKKAERKKDTQHAVVEERA